MELEQIQIEKTEKKQAHKLSDLFINATEQQCSGMRHMFDTRDNSKAVCAIGLIELYVSS